MAVAPPTPIGRDWIAAHIPHQGRMCLLDAVLQWSDEAIVCRAAIDDGDAHPLRRDGVLSMAHAIEYAAQAMAVHGALRAPEAATPAAGYLVSVRGVQLHQPELRAIDTPLRVSAERVSAVGTHVLYAFRIESPRGCLAEGRAAVVLDAATSTGAIP